MVVLAANIWSDRYNWKSQTESMASDLRPFYFVSTPLLCVFSELLSVCLKVEPVCWYCCFKCCYLMLAFWCSRHHIWSHLYFSSTLQFRHTFRFICFIAIQFDSHSHTSVRCIHVWRAIRVSVLSFWMQIKLKFA